MNLSQFHAWWFPGFLQCQAICMYVIDLYRMDLDFHKIAKHKYILQFIRSACKGLIYFPGRWGCKFQAYLNDNLSIFCEIIFSWMSQNLPYDLSTLVQVLAWCHQAPCHFLIPCWPGSRTTYGITMPQCLTCHSSLNMSQNLCFLWRKYLYWFCPVDADYIIWVRSRR